MIIRNICWALVIAGVIILVRLGLIIRQILKRRKSYATATKDRSPLVRKSSVQSAASLSGKRILVVLGSGGHTSEMMTLLTKLQRDKPEKITFVIGATDVTSETRTRTYDSRIRTVQQQQQLSKPVSDSDHSQAHAAAFAAVDPGSWGAETEYVKIPRAREVGQSFVSSIFTTLYALVFCIKLVLREHPHVILTNGPGTTVPVCWAGFFFLRVLGLSALWHVSAKSPAIIFVESYARVRRLSLTGYLLYPIASRFIVQWPQLSHRYSLTEYVGQLC